jgi:hypothetical protein
MKQTSFAQEEFAAKRKTARRERFLAEMEQAVPCSTLLKALSPHYYPDPRGKRGRPPNTIQADAADVLCAAVVRPGGRSTGSRNL